MKDGDELKTVFKTKYGLHEWLVMSFELINSSITFMKLMKHVLYIFIGEFIMIIYLFIKET